MGFKRENCPFFFEVNEQLEKNNEDKDEAKQELIARNPVFYKKTLFRAFLHLSQSEIEDMSIGEFMDYDIMLDETLKLIHAPYMNKEGGN